MSPRVPGSEPSFTRAQALLVAEAAGFDIDKPLRGQLDDGDQGGDEITQQLAAITDRLDKLAEGQAPAPAPERTFAQGLAGKLNEAQSTWYSASGEPENAA